MNSAIVVGLMSGTSLDGIAAAVTRFSRTDSGKINAELLAFINRAYTPVQRERLADALTGVSAAEYCRLNFDLGGWLAAARSSGVPAEWPALDHRPAQHCGLLLGSCPRHRLVAIFTPQLQV